MSEDCIWDADFKVNVGHEKGRQTLVCRAHIAETLRVVINLRRKAVVFDAEVNTPAGSSRPRCQFGWESYQDVVLGEDNLP